MGKKLTIEFVREQFEKEGYRLLTTVYTGAFQKLDYICPKGHSHSVNWGNWYHNGRRCPYCSGVIKKTIQWVSSVMKNEGYTLLSTVYKNAHSSLYIECPEGHRYYVKWNNWKNGRRCPTCANKGRNKKDFSVIKKSFKENNYILLAVEYKGNNQKLEYICPNGHRHSITWKRWQRGQKCPYCAFEKQTIRQKKCFSEIKESFENESYVLLTSENEYKTAHHKLKYICSRGHKHEISWTKWQQNRRCPVCKTMNMSGSGHYNWKGGISCEPYCDVWLDKDFKESIKQRDGHKCMNPACWATSKRLSIHHIDYVKKNCNPNNLITLCNSCNSRANKDRNWHKSWYQTIMYMRYGYKNVLRQEFNYGPNK